MDAVLDDNLSIKQQINTLDENERILCVETLKIARDLGASPDNAETVLNEIKIKIVHCRLDRSS